MIPDALILQVTTVAGEVEGDEPAVRVAYVQADPTAGFVPEGTDIDPADADLAEVIVQTGKVAVLSKLSNEASKSAEASRLISDSMSRAVIVKANTAFLSNPPRPRRAAQPPRHHRRRRAGRQPRRPGGRLHPDRV